MNKIFRFASVIALACATLVYTGCTKDFSQDISGVSEDVQTALAKIDALENSIAALNTWKSSVDATLAGKADITYVDSKANDILGKLNQAKSDLQGAIDSASQDLNTKISGVQETAEDAYEALFTPETGLIAQVAALEAELGVAKSDISALQSALATLTGRVDALEARIQAINWVPSSIGVTDEKYNVYNINGKPGTHKVVGKATFKVVPEAAAAKVSDENVKVVFSAAKAVAVAPEQVFDATKVFVDKKDASTGYVNVTYVVDSAKATKGLFTAAAELKGYFALNVVDSKIATDIVSDFVPAYRVAGDNDVLASPEIFKGSTSQNTANKTLTQVKLAWDDTAVDSTLIAKDYSVKFGGLSIAEVVKIFGADQDKFVFADSLLANSKGASFNFKKGSASPFLPVSVSAAAGLSAENVGDSATFVWYLKYDGISKASIKAPVKLFEAFGQIFEGAPVVEKVWNHKNFLAQPSNYSVDLDFPDMTALALRPYENKLGNRHDGWALTKANWNKVKAAAASKNVQAANNALNGGANGATYTWLTKEKATVQFPGGWAWGTDSVYVNEYRVDGKRYFVAAEAKYGKAPAAPKKLELTATLAHKGNHMFVADAIDQIYGQLAALDAADTTLANYFITHVVKASTNAGAYATEESDARTSGSVQWTKRAVVTSAKQAQEVKLFANHNKVDSSLIQVAVNTPATNAKYGMTYVDSLDLKCWGYTFPVVITAKVEKAPAYKFQIMDGNFHVTAEGNTANVYAALTAAGYPETVNLNQVLQVVKPAAASDPAVDEVTIKLLQIVDTIGLATDALGYKQATLNGAILPAANSVIVNAAGLANTANAVINIAGNNPITWGACAANSFTVKLGLFVEGEKTDEVLVKFVTDDPLAVGEFKGHSWKTSAALIGTEHITFKNFYDSISVKVKSANIAENQLMVQKLDWATVDAGVAMADSYAPAYNMLADCTTTGSGHGPWSVASSHSRLVYDSADATLLANLGVTVTPAAASKWYYTVGSADTKYLLSAATSASLVAFDPHQYATTASDVAGFWSHYGYDLSGHTLTAGSYYWYFTPAYVTLLAGNTLVDDVTVHIPVTLSYKYGVKATAESEITILFTKQ